MSTEADRLVARGREVTLADGSTVTVRFTFAVLAAIEREFDSVAEYSLSLATNLSGRWYEAVRGGMVAAAGVPVGLVDDLLDTTRIGDYALALDEALTEALPPLPDLPVVDEGKAPGGTTDSPGASTTTSEPSPSVAPTTSSGTG